MLRLAGRRLTLAIPIILLVMFVTFAMLQLTPGDPAASVAGENASPEELDRIRGELGLDRPMTEQFADYVGDVVRLDFGDSIRDRQPVLDLISDTLPVTTSLVALSLAISVLIAVPAGVLAAVYKQRWPDRLMSAGAALGLAIPAFVVAFILLVPLAIERQLLPAVGHVGLSEDPVEWFRHAILPAMALALVPAAELTRQIRSELVEVMEQDFIRTTRAKGVPERVVLVKHAFRNAAVPVITIFGLQLGRILGGAVVVERVFAISGFGSLAFDAVLAHDFPLIQGVVLVSAVIVVLANLLVDVANGLVNPKLRSA